MKNKIKYNFLYNIIIREFNENGREIYQEFPDGEWFYYERNESGDLLHISSYLYL